MSPLQDSGQLKRLLAGGIACESLYLFYRFSAGSGPAAILRAITIHAAAFLVLLGTYAFLGRDSFSRKMTATALLLAGIFQLTILSSQPVLSDDIYRYIWDGKVQAAGENPYRFAPDSPQLVALHSAQLPKLINHPAVRSVYPPLSQLLFRIGYWLCGESITGFKVVFVIFFFGSAWLFLRLLDQLGTDRRLLLLFAWNPLVVMETALSGHLDIVYIFFLLLGILFFLRLRPVLSGLAIAASIGVKLYSLVLLPVLLFAGFKNRGNKRFGFSFCLALAGAILVQMLPYRILTGSFLSNLLFYSKRWYFNNPLFYAVNALMHDNARVHLVLFSILSLLIAAITLSPFPLRRKVFYASAALAVCNPTIHPWYLVPLVGLLCLHLSWLAVAWSGTIAVSYLVLFRFRIAMIWKDSLPLLAAEYIPLLLLLVWLIIRRRHETTPNG